MALSSPEGFDIERMRREVDATYTRVACRCRCVFCSDDVMGVVRRGCNVGCLMRDDSHKRVACR